VQHKHQKNGNEKRARAGQTHMVHTTTFRVRFGELDPYNHVNHAIYVAWFEAGRGEALDSIGMSLSAMAELGFQVVVTDLSVQYKVPGRAEDNVTVETWVSEIGGARSTWSQRITRPNLETGVPTVLCLAEVRAGCTNSDGRPTRMPPELKAALARLGPQSGLPVG
jgi:acyl-CoA thioester hydrolase